MEYFVMKNTLSRFAAKNAGLDELCDVLEGTTSIAICEGDPVAAAKVVAEFSKKLADQNKFFIKAGFVDGKVISVEEVKALADLPSREVLVATVLGTLIAPHPWSGHCAGRQHLWPGPRDAGHRRPEGRVSPSPVSNRDTPGKPIIFTILFGGILLWQAKRSPL